MDSLTAEDLVAFFAALAAEMPGHQEMLRELDASIGDGDLGVTIAIGMKGIEDGLADLASQDCSAIIARSGMNFNRAAASTFGAIFATGLMRMGQAVKGKDAVAVGDLGPMVTSAMEGIMQRGGAKPGEKTLLDVLEPMAEALGEAAQAGASMEQAAEAAYAACLVGLERTKEMEGRHGRAGWFRERSKGVQDPGSTAICLMVDCFRRFVAQRAG